MTEHHLISVITNHGGAFHGYLITESHEDLETAYDKMFTHLAENNMSFLPAILDTTLDDGKELVETYIREQLKQSSALDRYKEKCFIAWFTPDGDPQYEELMALH